MTDSVCLTTSRASRTRPFHFNLRFKFTLDIFKLRLGRAGSSSCGSSKTSATNIQTTTTTTTTQDTIVDIDTTLKNEKNERHDRERERDGNLFGGDDSEREVGEKMAMTATLPSLASFLSPAVSQGLFSSSHSIGLKLKEL